MTISLRRFSPLDILHRISSRSALAACSTLAVGAALLGAAAPAGAVVTTVGSTTVGLQPRNVASVLDGTIEEIKIGLNWEWEPFPDGATFANPVGNPVLHKSEAFAIYWDPADRYDGDWQHVIDGYLQNVGAASATKGNNDFTVDTQYTDKSNRPASYSSTYRGAYTDTAKYPTSLCTDPHPLEEWEPSKAKPLACLTDQQVRQQLQAFIAANNLPKGMGSIFYLLMPPGVTVCLDAASTHCSDYEESSAEGYEQSFCSYHSDINPDETASGDGNTVLYAVVPWTAGGAGDPNLNPINQLEPAYPCQDGGFDPSSKPIEEKEHEKKRGKKEQEEFEEKSAQQQKEAEAALRLENPHVEEPNQVPCPSSDGGCDTGLADLIINQMAVEQQNIVTNPLLNAWQDENRNEATDECRNFFASGQLEGSSSALPGSLAGTLSNQQISSGKYYLNTAFNLAGVRLSYPGIACIGGINLVPQFTAPNPVNSGETVGFDGMESDITLNSGTHYSGSTPETTYATYAWNFGDGSPEVSGYAPGAPACESPWLLPCAASVFHSYQYGGTYEVTLTVTDVGGNVAKTTQLVTVVGPPPPAPPSTGGTSGSTGGTSGGQTTGSTGTTPGSTPSVPSPIAAAAVVSRSLRTVLHKGLVVRYSVNEQVAGHFDVMLPSAIAHKLGILGTTATGLPSGSAPEMVIAKAVLVTTKGGRSAVDIQFSKRTAARLARLHKVTLLLRLIVRNASTGAPVTTTVLSSVTLTH